VLGPIVGSMLFWFVLQFLDSFLNQAVLHTDLGEVLDATDVGPIRFALVGLALILLIVFRPQGIFGNREEALIGEQ
jgi:neutral amino acid transport system permease protein